MDQTDPMQLSVRWVYSLRLSARAHTNLNSLSHPKISASNKIIYIDYRFDIDDISIGTSGGLGVHLQGAVGGGSGSGLGSAYSTVDRFAEARARAIAKAAEEEADDDLDEVGSGRGVQEDEDEATTSEAAATTKPDGTVEIFHL